MEDQKIIESLDCLWFFSNIFSVPPPPPPPPPPPCCSDGKTTQSHLQDSPSPRSNQKIPIIPIPQPEQVQASDTKNQVQTSIELESKLQLMKPVTMGALETPELVKKEQRRGRERRRHKYGTKRRGNDQRKQKQSSEVERFRSFDFCYGDIDLDGRVVPMVPRLQRSGNPSLGSGCKMPPLSDGMAMKKHLRSWAYAVACAVR